MAERYIRIQAAPLKELARQMAVGVGIRPEWAELVAESLVESNLRGVDSHGVQLLNYYIDHMASGCVALDKRGHVVSESGGCLLYDGENGVGQVVSDAATDHAIRLAKAHGVALVTVRESNHFGAAAFWAKKMAAEGLIGMVMCNATPQVPPWQAKDPRFGTNPICMAVPGRGEHTWLLDMATTTVAMGKIFKARFSGEKTIPAGWAFDSEGVPTTDTEAAYRGLPMPLGGYKGSGLAFMVEILVAVLSGGAMSTDLGGIRNHTKPMRAGQMFLAIDVARYMPVEQFLARMDDLVGRVKAARPAPGYDEVLIANEPEWRSKERRLNEGITLSEGVWQELVRVAASVKVTAPEVEAAAG